MSLIRIAIFEDNQSLRESLALLIRQSENCTLVGTFADARHAVDDVRRCAPDVVLMDIRMPHSDGIEATQLIRQACPGVAVLIQTIFEDDERIFAAVCAGASGYILKGTTPDQLLGAIREVRVGGAPMTPHIARKVLRMFQHLGREAPATDYHLSAREQEVLQCLVKGASYKMIADQLHIGYETVRSHMKHIYEKLHVTSMTEAVAKALREGLV